MIQEGTSQNIQINRNEDFKQQDTYSNPEANNWRTTQIIKPGEYLQQLRNARRNERVQVDGNEQQNLG